MKPDQMRAKTPPPVKLPTEMTDRCMQCGHLARYHVDGDITRPCAHCNAYGGLCEGARK